MRQQKHTGKIVALLTIATVLLTASCCLGLSQSRYENYSQWQAIYKPQQQVLDSDRLVPGGQTVLLPDWNVNSTASRMEAIGIIGSVGEVKGVLYCTSDCPEYMTASLDRSEITVGTTDIQIQLTMTPTQAAMALREPTTATVRVELLPEGAEEPTLWTDYRVVLTGTDLEEPKSLRAEETRPEETESEETQPEEAQPEETEPEETEPEEPQPALLALSIDSTDIFAWEEQLAVSIAVPADTDTLILTMDDANFPGGTRYTYNNETFLLGADMPIEIAIQDEENLTLRLDFSALSAPQSGEISLQARILYQQEVIGFGEITVDTTREALHTDLEVFNPVLTGKNALNIPLCADTNGLTWRLEMLTETEEGVTYAQSDEQYYLVISISEETDDSEPRKCITISNVSGKAPAGTYRLTLERLQDEQIIGSTQILFFICY